MGSAQTKRVLRLALTGDVILSRPVSMLEDTPLTAAPEEAERIITELAATSRAYGTTVRWEGATGTGRVMLA